MTEDAYAQTSRRLRSPPAAAIAGIIFSLLYSFSFVLIRMAIPSSLTEQIVWVEAQRENVELALRILPFAGIAFIWFIAVVRERLGRLEDRFFSTIFFGSGLLYLAMSFSASAIAGGVIITYALVPDFSVDTTTYVLNRAIISQISNIYGVRMAGLCMTSLGTIWIRTRLMPPLLAYLTLLLAIGLLTGSSLSLWIVLIFPAWVLVVSAYILYLNLFSNRLRQSDGMTVE
jgi:hypothetical protein